MMDPALVHKIIYQRLMDLCHQLLCLAVTPLTQRTSSTRTRMKWDRNMNVAVVRSHFKALIENPDTYSKSLHKNFKETYPDLDVTAQRVLDQKRTIFNRACTNTSGTGRAKKLHGAWISQAELDAIKAEADILYTGRNGIPCHKGQKSEINIYMFQIFTYRLNKI